jgi:pimeloyl-ACP methyl ester carboxylesterase
VTLNHVRRGSGDPLLLIHGIGGDWRSWEPLIERFAAEREVVAVDMPGFGDSTPLAVGRPPTARALAEAVADFAEEHVGTEAVDIAGHSLGGWVGLELAKMGRARRVVAVAPAGFWTPLEAAYVRASLKLTVVLSRKGAPLLSWAFGHPLLRAGLAAGQFGHPRRVSEQAVRRMNDVLRRSTGYDDTLEAMTRDRFSGGADVGVPVTIVWGSRDRLLLPREAPGATREIPGAELLWVEGGGHFAHWDDQDLVARAVLAGEQRRLPDSDHRQAAPLDAPD